MVCDGRLDTRRAVLQYRILLDNLNEQTIFSEGTLPLGVKPVRLAS